jgi:hypothetical protein
MSSSPDAQCPGRRDGDSLGMLIATFIVQESKRWHESDDNLNMCVSLSIFSILFVLARSRSIYVVMRLKFGVENEAMLFA